MARLVVGMLVKNEKDRYLSQVLNQIIQISDHMVFLDDHSTDGTPDFIFQKLKDKSFTISIENNSLFGEEYKLREKLWSLCVSQKPDWIMILDADELIESTRLYELKSLLDNVKEDSVNMRLYDMWSPTHYRSDRLWCAHNYYSRFIVRYKPEIKYTFPPKNHHVGRFPQEVVYFSGYDSSIRIKHMGWSNPQDRIAKYHRYMKYDPEGKYGNLDQYYSILDPNPNLELWTE